LTERRVRIFILTRLSAKAERLRVLKNTLYGCPKTPKTPPFWAKSPKKEVKKSSFWPPKELFLPITAVVHLDRRASGYFTPGLGLGLKS